MSTKTPKKLSRKAKQAALVEAWQFNAKEVAADEF